jgi:peptidoglycan-associated lipoprotein
MRIGKLIVPLFVITALLLAGCSNKKQAAQVTAPPKVAPPPAPVASLSVTPAIVEKGQSAELSWQTSNASTVTIEGIGPVAASGSRQITPAVSTTYQLSAHGDGGATEASARVTVNMPKPAVSALTDEEMFRRSVKDIFFNYDQSEIRADEQPVLSSDVQFLVQHPQVKVVIEGHCDERGSDEYNMGLGESRASTVKQQLAQHGVSPDRIRIVSYGKEKPFCSTENENCYQENRRAHFVFSN